MELLKALLHIDEPVKWQLTLTNAQNLIRDVGSENVILEIVANAAAVKIFDSADQDVDRDMISMLKQMQELSNNNVKIIVCRNALRANSIREELLPGFATVVPAGITRLIVKQSEGYAYIKP
jgi:intracellular sulfur oxidation DsrE/DsrF family protein